MCAANILVPENPLKAPILPTPAARAELVRRRPHRATARADAPHHPVDGSPNAMRLREDKKETEREDNIL